LSTQSVFEQRVIPGFSPYRCNGFMVRRRRLLPPGYGLDTPDGGTWALRRPDGARRCTYFGVWGASREAVERAAREDHARRKGREERCQIDLPIHPTS
jgi:hypothetical protein